MPKETQRPNIRQIIQNQPDKVKFLLESSGSLSNVMEGLSVNPHNTSARQAVVTFAKEHNIPVPIYNRGAQLNLFTPVIKDDKIKNLFVKSEKQHSNLSLKKYILQFDLLPYKCTATDCGLVDEWKNKKLNLHLDHKNGDNTDNRLANLRFLCPNCHSQTDTYTAKNSHSYKNMPITDCLRCGEISKNGSYCRACEPYTEEVLLTREQKIEAVQTLPSQQELQKLVSSMGTSYVLRHFAITLYSLQKYLEDETYRDNYQYRHTKGVARPESLKASYPPVEELLARIEVEGYQVLARELGVDGNAIRKHLKVRTGSYPKTMNRKR